MLKGCPIFLAHVTTKETEDKSEDKRLKDVPIVQDFPEVFPEDLSGLPSTRQVEFQIDLIPSSIGLVQKKRIVGPTEGAIQQRIYKAQFLTLGSSGLVCQEEGWIISNVHRLSRTDKLTRIVIHSQGLAIYLTNFKDRVNDKEHEEHLKAILKLLKNEEFYAKFSKCEF
ncbi:hypothetical protein Tco_0055742 [Tanacetum coccineum]